MYADSLNTHSGLPRIAMISTHGYVTSTPRLDSADTGEQVLHVLELSRNLARLGYEVDIWTRQFEDQPVVEPVAERVRIVRAACGGRSFIPKQYLYEEMPVWAVNAFRLAKDHELEYRFVNSHYWDGGVAGQHFSEMLSVPHLHTPHSLGAWKRRQLITEFPEDSARFEQQFNFTHRIEHERLLYSVADAVVATTPEQLEQLVEDYDVPADKCRMIPPGYDDSLFFPVSDASRDAIRQSLGFDRPTILAMGPLATDKGYDLLIRAFRLVADRQPAALLRLAVVAGEISPEQERTLHELRSIVEELELADNVQFADLVPADRLADHYRAADLFVLSSRYEPFGMTAVEAMACGTPAIVTVHGGLHRVLTLGRDALSADPVDRDDLGTMMWRALNSADLRARLSRMGAHKARDLFTWTAIAEALVELADTCAD